MAFVYYLLNIVVAVEGHGSRGFLRAGPCVCLGDVLVFGGSPLHILGDEEWEVCIGRTGGVVVGQSAE